MSRSVYPFLFTRLMPAAAALALVSLPALALEPLAPPAPLDPATLTGAQPAPALTAASPDAAIAPLTLPQALARAWATNPDLQAARHDVDAAAGGLLQAGTRPNPSLELAVEDQRRQTRETTFLVSQPLELGNKRAARVLAAQGEQQGVAAALRQQQADLQASVVTRFVAVLAAQEHLQLAQESVALAARAHAASTRLVELGKAAPMQATETRVAAAEARLQLQQAEHALGTARLQLAATWNAPLAHFAQADGALATLPRLPELTQLLELLAQAPQLILAQAELAHRQALAQVEQSQRLPDVTLGLGVKRLADEGRNRAIVEVSLPLPLFDSNRGNVLQALRHSDAAQSRLRATELRLQGKLRQTHAALALALEQARTFQTDILPGAESGYRAVTRGVAQGKFSLDAALDAQRVLLQARSQHLDALVEIHHRHAELMRLIGASPFPDPESSP